MVHRFDLSAPRWRAAGTVASAALFFLAVCLCSAATSKGMTIFLILLTLCTVFLCYERMRDRFQPPIFALGLLVLMDGLSCFYAVAGKFALMEFLKVLCAFCLALLLLAYTGEQNPGRRAASVLAGCCAIAGLVSIDLLSTRWLSTPVLALLGQFTTDYAHLDAVEEGVRLLSVFMAPNPFAGCMGIGVLLSLGLAATAETPGARAVHLVCLSVTSLAFMLAFSMGACLTILPAFLVLLALTGRERRAGLLLFMAETLVVTMLAAFPISLTSMTTWTGVRPIPLLCTVGGAAALCALELLWGRRAAARLSGHGRAVLYVSIGLAAALAAFAAAACLLTTGVTLQPGETLRRSAYPEPGAYTLSSQAGGPAAVTVESQNRAGAIMHTSDLLYSGPLDQAAFTVPEDSLVVYFTFSAEAEVQLDRVEYRGEGGSGGVPLGYRLLPGFVANRLQGLRANQNAIQRFIFFEDGMKLFRRSPVVGLGLGGFENGLRAVQSFDYGTRYVHNHYIQALVDTGVVGLALFLALLAVSGLAVWRARRTQALSPALGAALVFMAGHAMVEVVFSYYAYLPIAFGVFAAISLCCANALPVPAWAEKKGVRPGLLLGTSALMLVFGVLLSLNMTAGRLARNTSELADLERAAALDRFEWADYMLSYVVWSANREVDGATRQKADEYAARLERLESNSIPIRLAEYYFKTGRPERGLSMVEQYVGYVSASTDGWQKAFDLLEEYEQDTQAYRTGVAHIVELLYAWNEKNMGHIELDEHAQAFIARVCP